MWPNYSLSKSGEKFALPVCRTRSQKDQNNDNQVEKDYLQEKTKGKSNEVKEYDEKHFS